MEQRGGLGTASTESDQPLIVTSMDRLSYLVSINILTGYGKLLLTVIVTILSIPIIFNGIENYYIIPICGYFVGVISIFSVNINDGMRRNFVIAEARGNRELANEFLTSGLLFALGISCIAFLCVVALSPWLPGWLGIEDPDLVRTTRKVLLIMSFAHFPLAFLVSLAYDVLLGNQRKYMADTIIFCMFLLEKAIVLLCVKYSPTPLSVAMVFLFVQMLSFLITLVVALRSPVFAKYRLRKPTWRTVRQMVLYSRNTWVIGCQSTVRIKTIPLLLGYLFGPSLVLQYYVGDKVTSTLLRCSNQVSEAILPAMLLTHGRGEHQRTAELLQISIRYGLVVFCALAAPLALLHQQLMLSWMGAGYEEAAEIMTILLFTASLIVVLMPAEGYLIRARHHRYVIEVRTLALTALFLSIYPLARSLRVTGVVIASALMILILLCFFLKKNISLLPISWRELFHTSLIPGITCALLSLLFTYLLTQIIPPTHLWEVGLITAIAAGGSSLITGAVFATSKEKQHLVTILQSTLEWIGAR